MAVTPVSALFAREKSRYSSRSAGVFYLLKTFFLNHATNNQNADLLYVPIDGVVSSSDGGASASQVLADAPCKLYCVWLKKNGATATSFKASNSATTAGTDGTQVLGYIMTTANQENLFVFPTGHSFSAGLTVTENTTATGSTLTLSANRIDGFAIIGAP